MRQKYTNNVNLSLRYLRQNENNLNSETDLEQVSRHPVREPEPFGGEVKAVGGALVEAGIHLRFKMPEQTVCAFPPEKRFHLLQVDAGTGT